MLTLRMIDIEKYSKYLSFNKNLDDSSILQAVSKAKVFFEWLNGRDITEEVVSDFFLEIKRTRSPNTYNTYVFGIKKLFEFMGITFGKDISVVKKKTIKRIEILSVSELKRILGIDLTYGLFRGKPSDCLNETYKALNLLLAHTGARLSEAINLKVCDCDLLEGKIWFVNTKNGEDRQAFIQEPILGLLNRLCKPKEGSDYVFTNAIGNKLIQTVYGQDLRRRAHKAGIKKRVHAHIFRHSFATHLIANGVDISKVAGLLGHKDIQTTFNNYVHLASDMLQEASTHLPLNLDNMRPDDLFRYTVVKLKEQLPDNTRLDISIAENSNTFSLRIAIKDSK